MLSPHDELLRFLEDTNTTMDNNSTGNSTDTSEDDDTPSDGRVLRDTFIVYGSVFVVVFFLFCWVRKRFPKAYTIRAWASPDIQTDLAQNQYGWFSWLWQLFFLTDDQVRTACGMDSLCFLRMLRVGFKISLVGIFNGLWLMPLYGTSPYSDETAHITEGATKVTISYVPSSSPRLIATALASYILFFYIMYAMLKEFEWFTEQRHKFLVTLVPRNYAVYVQNIPPEFCSKAALERFFGRVYSKQSVLEATPRVKTTQLSKVVAKRDATVTKLEHAIAYEQQKGTAPTHRSSLVGGTQVDSIPAYAEELKELNRDVTERITTIETAVNSSGAMDSVDDSESVALILGSTVAPDGSDSQSLLTNEVASLTGNKESSIGDFCLATIKSGEEVDDLEPLADEEDPHDDTNESDNNNGKKNVLAQGLTSFKASAAMATSMAKSMVSGEEDGKLYNAAFVTFTKLSAVHGAMQTIQSAKPFAMEVLEAPEPEDIFWANVGRQHKDLQVGKLMSAALTALTCLFWTIPMAFFASLSSVEGLKNQFSWLADAIEKFPALEPILEQLAPLLVVVFSALLPVILTVFTILEGPLSGATVEASLFGKLAVFAVVQTFFVSAISGGIFEEISNMIEDPTSIIDLLATSLPSKSTYFIQILIVGTVVAVGIELLRVVPLVQAALRSCIGPKLTEKERQTTFMGLRPLYDPLEFQHADVFSTIVLSFMIVFVYAVIAPLVTFVSAFCFLWMSAAYRNQFVYIYPATPDSGGKLWLNCVRILLICMLVAEIVIVGLLGLKKSAIGVVLMIPLIIIQILFNTYVGQQHYTVPQYLPAIDSLKADMKNGSALDVSSLKGAFVQPELQTKEVLPEGLSPSQQLLLGFNSADETHPPSDTEADIPVREESSSNNMYYIDAREDETESNP